MFRSLRYHPDGHKLPRPEVVIEDLGSAPAGRTLIIQLPGGWCFFVDIGFEVSRFRFKQLVNRDVVAYTEVVEPDDWRDQPRRRDGSPW